MLVEMELQNVFVAGESSRCFEPSNLFNVLHYATYRFGSTQRSLIVLRPINTINYESRKRVSAHPSCDQQGKHETYRWCGGELRSDGRREAPEHGCVGFGRVFARRVGRKEFFKRLVICSSFTE